MSMSLSPFQLIHSCFCRVSRLANRGLFLNLKDYLSFSIINMVSYVEIKGFEDFDKYTKNIGTEGPPIFFFFSGQKLPDGNSWCPDCVVAEPVVKSYLSSFEKNIVFVYVDVGNREYWKDKACPFRTDSRTKLMVIPTLVRWKGVQRLEGEQCAKADLLQMLFEEEEE